MSHSNRKAFSLVELMITVVIIGVLAAIAVPSYNKYALKSKTAEAYIGIEITAKNQATFFLQNKEFLVTNATPGYCPSPAPEVALHYPADSTGWDKLGRPFPTNSSLQFCYTNSVGKNNATGGYASTPTAHNTYLSGATTQYYGGNSKYGVQCSPMLMSNYVTIPGTPHYNWVLITATANFKADTPANPSTCTRLYKLVDTNSAGTLSAGGRIGTLNLGE